MNKKIEKFSKYALEIIEEYKNLDFGDGMVIKCPYFRNYRKSSGSKLRALTGKGKPSEIITETKINAHLFGFDWKMMNKENLRTFMEKNHIGIDCSGFVTWIFYFWFKKQYRINFFGKVRKAYKSNPRKWFRLLLRAAQNIDVITLTSPKLSLRITDLNKVKPGDMIRSKKGKHILLITEVQRQKNKKISRISYVHSTWFYGQRSGIREDDIIITDNRKELKDQKWLENDGQSQKKKNWTYAGIKEDDGKNGIYRLKFLEKLQ